MASSSDASQLSSPYPLHPSDSPSLVLVSGHLTRHNFFKQQRALRRALNAKNKFYFVDDTFKAPANTSTICAQWIRTKDMVLTWILNTITPSLPNYWTITMTLEMFGLILNLDFVMATMLVSFILKEKFTTSTKTNSHP